MKKLMRSFLVLALAMVVMLQPSAAFADDSRYSSVIDLGHGGQMVNFKEGQYLKVNPGQTVYFRKLIYDLQYGYMESGWKLPTFCNSVSFVSFLGNSQIEYTAYEYNSGKIITWSASTCGSVELWLTPSYSDRVIIFGFENVGSMPVYISQYGMVNNLVSSWVEY